VALVSVTKCQGTGNDFIILDARGHPELPYATLAKSLCHRRFSIGADGLLVVHDARDPGVAAGMRTFNADGSEAEMCGNGIRCVARYLYERDHRATAWTIQTPAGRIQTAIVDWQGGIGVQVEMGVPLVPADMSAPGVHSVRIGDELAPAYPVTIGNPHVVVFTHGDPFASDIEKVAAAAIALRDCDANVELVKAFDGRLRMRVHERGVGETWACGTGACAAAAAAIASHRVATPVLVESKGGVVSVAWDGPGRPAMLVGNAELVFRTEIGVAASEPSRVAP
jgi:diaminopimelate epimerase